MSQDRLQPGVKASRASADPKGKLTVGEVARRCGLTVSTLHFYEAKGLIEGSRSPGNQRRYSLQILPRIAVIRIAQRAGLPLAVIKEHLSALPAERIAEPTWRELSENLRGLVDKRITSLLQLRDQIKSCIGCGCLSLEDCPLCNPEDILSREPGITPLLATSCSDDP